MTDRTPDPRLVDAVAEAMDAWDEWDGEHATCGSEHPGRLCPQSTAEFVAAALVGVVVLKTDLRQVGHLTKNGWLIENSHDDPGFALTHDAAPVFVLVEPEAAGSEGTT